MFAERQTNNDLRRNETDDRLPLEQKMRDARTRRTASVVIDMPRFHMKQSLAALMRILQPPKSPVAGVENQLARL